MTLVTKKVPNEHKKFHCECCDYLTCRESQYIRHCSTAKHKMVTTVTDCHHIVPESSAAHKCENCNKTYKSRNGLWQHSKKCDAKTIQQPVVENLVMDTTMIMNIFKENQEFKALLFEQSRQVMELQVKQSELIHKLVDREPGNSTINTNCNNTTNNNNQKFNLNFFLNETCKDAMNIQEFMENLRITFQDLLKIGNEGFINGVSDIFIKELRDLDVTKRPIHCTDSKRDTIYLKENGEWNKDDKEKTKLKQVIEKVEYKNVAVLQQWCNDTPDSKINNSDNNLLRDKIYLQTLQGDDKTREKIIKNISKEVMVDKEHSLQN